MPLYGAAGHLHIEFRRALQDFMGGVSVQQSATEEVDFNMMKKGLLSKQLISSRGACRTEQAAQLVAPV